MPALYPHRAVGRPPWCEARGVSGSPGVTSSDWGGCRRVCRTTLEVQVAPLGTDHWFGRRRLHLMTTSANQGEQGQLWGVCKPGRLTYLL
jgi:hypothetical protein